MCPYLGLYSFRYGTAYRKIQVNFDASSVIVNTAVETCPILEQFDYFKPISGCFEIPSVLTVRCIAAKWIEACGLRPMHPFVQTYMYR